MQAITREGLEHLWNHETGPCVSLYMPTHGSGPDVQADPIRLKNLLARAAEALQGLGLRAPEARELLAPAAELTGQGSFWRESAAGLAVFIAPGLFETMRLHDPVQELAVVGGRFHAKPLVAEWLNDAAFYLLAATLKDVRLYRGDRHGLQPVALEDTPAGLEAFLAYDDIQPTHQPQRQGPGAGGRGTAPQRGADPGNAAKRDVERYLQAVARGVERSVPERSLPLVWAGVEEWFGIFRDASAWPHLLPTPVTGNPERLSEQTLHQRAWAVVAPLLKERSAEARVRFHDALGTGRAAADLNEVLRAAHEGRVSALFCARDAHRWGARGEEGRPADVHAEQAPGDEDLLDAALRDTLRHGGEAHVVEAAALPDAPGVAEAGLAALFRY